MTRIYFDDPTSLTRARLLDEDSVAVVFGTQATLSFSCVAGASLAPVDISARGATRWELLLLAGYATPDRELYEEVYASTACTSSTLTFAVQVLTSRAYREVEGRPGVRCLLVIRGYRTSDQTSLTVNIQLPAYLQGNPDASPSYDSIEARKAAAAAEASKTAAAASAASAAESAATASQAVAVHNAASDAHAAIMALKADLVDGKVPSAQLPSYVDDVEEYPSLSQFPVPGQQGKIYVALDTNRSYRWSGSEYICIGTGLELGETSTTAFAGSRGVALEQAMPYKADLVDGKVPASELPEMDYIPLSQKGAASGVATLGADSRVPSSQLPPLDYIPTAQKGAASGVATLDADAKVPASQLPAMDYIPLSQKGAASGVAELDADAKVPLSRLPSALYRVTLDME